MLFYITISISFSFNPHDWGPAKDPALTNKKKKTKNRQKFSRVTLSQAERILGDSSCKIGGTFYSRTVKDRDEMKSI